MHIGLAGVPPRTDDFLHFIVVGGGIAGLATAWSLRKAGHRATVFEKQCPDVMAQCREGVRSTPTMTQVLNDWGLGDKLCRTAAPILQMTFLDGKSGEELGLIAVDKVMETLPADFSCVQYGALFTIFYDLAREADVELHFDTTVVSVDPWCATVTAGDGRRWTADIIVGADGAESTVRPVVLEASTPLSDRDNRFTVNLVVPADVARQDEELAALLDAKSWTGWFADDCSMTGVLTGPGSDSDYALVMNITIHTEDLWEEFPMSLESLRVDLFEPRIQKLLKMAEQLSKVVFTHYEPFDNWVHESGKVVLVGEAAHPIIPSGSHNTCMCIEDAMTLSVLFSLPAAKPQTAMLLSVYEELRQPRCASVQRYVQRKREVITIPHGPGQRRRDALLRDQRACHLEDKLEDEFLYNTYTGFVQVYGFVAREVVQDWWVKWGKSVLNRSVSTDSEEEDDYDSTLALSPVVIDAEVEKGGPTYPLISDPLMGEDEVVLREAEAHRRRSTSCLHFSRLNSSS